MSFDLGYVSVVQGLAVKIEIKEIGDEMGMVFDKETIERLGLKEGETIAVDSVMT